jgi:hypothetical protein
MFTVYERLNANIASSISNHLLEADALPPTTALTQLAFEITKVVFVEMDRIGLSRETIDAICKPKAARTASTRSVA